MKIVKTDLFKEQEKHLPKEVKDSIKKALKSIVKNPTAAPNTMQLFTKPTPEEMRLWMGRIQASTIDLVFEYLTNKNCLNKRGKTLAKDFWKKYIEIND